MLYNSVGFCSQSEPAVNIHISPISSTSAQLVNNPPAMQETLVQFLGLEDPLEKGQATQSSILAWRIPWTDSPWGCKELDMTWRLSLSQPRSHPPSHSHRPPQSTGLTSLSSTELPTSYQVHTQ